MTLIPYLYLAVPLVLTNIGVIFLAFASLRNSRSIKLLAELNTVLAKRIDKLENPI